ncbi:MAG: LysR family transcriptional regulator [Desulfobacteraceae bacterium]|nr:LysR family transcriptional regulator [Desulfobacteraceae bacterium]
MDIWQLHIFCKVVELKSFSKAGKAVHLSQPTVSSHIKELEDHFESRLVDRLSKEVTPTKAGELLYKYARKLVAIRDEAETALAEFHGQIKGRLVIGGSTIPGVHIIPKIIGKFIKTYPEVTLSLVIGDTEKIINDTCSGTLELGIVGARAKDKRIVQETLVEDEMYLIVPKGHKWAGKKRIKLATLLKEPFIIRESGSGTLKSFQQSLAHTGYSIEDLNIIAEMGSTGAVIQGIKNSIGISVLSAIAVSEDMKAGTLKALAVEGLDLKRNFYLTTYKYRSASPLCKAFTEFLMQEMKSMVYT